jgi:hypothetical protein
MARKASGASVLVLLAAIGQAADFEPPPVLQAADLAPAAIMKGPKHLVDPAARGDGFLVDFSVKSEFGIWDALDREMLEIRVKEVYSLDELSEVSKGEVFARAFARAAEKKARAVGHVVTDPMGTAKAIPGGVARFARGVSRTAKGAYDKATADRKDAAPNTRSATDKAKATALKGADAAGNLIVAGVRREWARKVGADPYTTNKQLADKLDDVAWAAYAGGFALSVVVPTIPGLGMVETADTLVYQFPPGEVLKRNDAKLKAAGVSDAARKALFVNGNFTAGLQSELTDAIAALGTVTGVSAVVSLAAESRSEGDARYIRRCVQLLAAGTKQVGGWKALATSENEIEATAADGRLVLPWSVDYLTWNAETLPADTPAVRAAKAREIWITGTATPLAKQELEAQRFEVREKKPLEP